MTIVNMTVIISEIYNNMAKLYMEATSDKGGRVASKGGDEYITVQLSNGNLRIFEITFKDDGHKRGDIHVMSYCRGIEHIQIIPYDPNPF